MTDLSNEHLLASFRRGDRSAFDALFRRYSARVHATALRLTGQWEDADDTLQEVFIRLVRNAGSIRQGKALPAWIYRTTVNCAHDCLRRRRPTISIEAAASRGANVIAVESVRRQAESDRKREEESLLRQIERLVPRLPERQAAVFVLRSFQGLSHRDIATVLGCSPVSARSHYSLACRKMRLWCREDAAAAGESNSLAAVDR